MTIVHDLKKLVFAPQQQYGAKFAPLTAPAMRVIRRYKHMGATRR